jgi:PPP family 3-phenylpropionic acid transporter
MTQRNEIPVVAAPTSRLWIAKLYYLLYYAAIGALAPFFNIFLQERGLNGAQIGLIGSIPPLITLVASPFWAGIADRSHRHQLILALCVGLAGVVSFGFLGATGFGALIALVVALAFFRAPVSALLDSIVLAMIRGTHATYGRQRLFGSIGYIAFTFGAGLVLTAGSLGMVFVIHGVLLIAGCTLLSFFLPTAASTERVDLGAGLRVLAGRRAYVSFLAMNMLQGMGTAAFFGFLGLHLVAIGATEAQVGLAFALAALAEIPIMFAGAWVQRRLRLAQMIVLGLIGVGSAYLLIGLAPTPALALAVTPFIGIFYGTYWMGVVAYAAEAAPPGLRATGQALMNAAQFGMGWAVGSVIAGIVWGAFGGGWVFLLGALALFAAATIFTLGQQPKDAVR